MAEDTTKTNQATDNPGAVGIRQQEQREAVDISRAVYGGTLVLRTKPEFLPQYPKEDKDVYEDRLAQTVLFGAYKKTIKSLTGIVYREQPTIAEEVPDVVKDHMGNIDLAGQHIFQFSQQEFRDKEVDGHVDILVDWHGPDGALSPNDEDKMEARPYWTLIRKSQEVRAEPRRDGGAVILGSFAYSDTEVRRKGEFEQVEVLMIRQFDYARKDSTIILPDEPLPPKDQRRVLFRSWVKKPDRDSWEIEEGGTLLGERMTRIPVVTDYAERTGFMQSEPPILDQGLENLKHWQIRSDRDQSLHTASIAILAIFGKKAEEVDTIAIGTSLGLAFDGSRTEDGAEYVEAMGHGLTHTRQELLDIQQRMAAIGVSMLERSTRQAETEEKVKLDQKGQDSELTFQATLTNAALKEALELHAMWMDEDPKGWGVFLNTDYSAQLLDPRMVDVLLRAVGEGALAVETFWDRLVAGKELPENFDPELEKDRIAQGNESTLAAVAELARQAREAAATQTVEEVEIEEAGLEA